MNLSLILFSSFYFISTSALKITVYYESLCPDSQRFITKQLYPTYQKLSDHLEVDLVPYGKARHTWNPYSISCQHGANECYGNTVQACMIKRLPEKDQIDFVNCVMKDRSPHSAAKRCAKDLGLNFEDADRCVKSMEGQRIMAELGDRTHALNPSVTFVPTIVFNDVYNAQTQSRALSNLKKVVCSKLPSPKPDECR